MAEHDYKLELPRNIERYVAALSKLYGQEGERLLQQIIVNAQTRVHEEWSHGNWNGGTWGHALYLIVPDVLYLTAAKQKDTVEERIRNDLGRVHNVPNEFIEKVFLEMEVSDDSDWRQESGVLLQGTRVVSDEATKRIWAEGQYRLFLSRKSEAKREAAELSSAAGSVEMNLRQCNFNGLSGGCVPCAPPIVPRPYVSAYGYPMRGISSSVPTPFGRDEM